VGFDLVEFVANCISWTPASIMMGVLVFWSWFYFISNRWLSIISIVMFAFLIFHFVKWNSKAAWFYLHKHEIKTGGNL